MKDVNPFQRGPFEPPPFDLGIEEMMRTEVYTSGYHEESWRLRFGPSVEYRMRAIECALRPGPDGVWEIYEQVIIGSVERWPSPSMSSE